MQVEIGVPNPRQAEFFRSRARFTAYGGARGGGKSWAVRKKAMLLALHYSGIRLLILRRSFPELRENHILPLLKELTGMAAYRDSDKSFTFPNGSRLRFGYCDNETDVLQYQGQEYDVIFIDEATQFTEMQYITLTACIRGANNFPKRMYLTCNPGGVGHDWVKRLFIDKRYLNEEKPEDYCFIPAKVYDNTALTETDKGYVSMLKNLPEDLRRAWLDGDWDVFAGQYFTEFRRDKHVISPFIIPVDWRRYFTMDYGLDMLAGYWIATAPDGTAYVYKEIYKSNLIISEAARLIKEHINEQIYAYIAPSDLWNRRQDTGKSAAQIFSENGISLIKASNNRVQGWYDLKEWLHVPEGGRPRLQMFANCENLIRSIPLLQHDAHDPNDCATEPHEITHAPDALRYWCAGRPRSAPVAIQNEDDIKDYDEQINEFIDWEEAYIL